MIMGCRELTLSIEPRVSVVRRLAPRQWRAEPRRRGGRCDDTRNHQRPLYTLHGYDRAIQAQQGDAANFLRAF